MKFISWNVNGLRAAIKKGFVEKLAQMNPDIIGLQEIKLSEGQLELELDGYELYYNYAQRKGYSGTAVFTKLKPLSVNYGIGIEEHDTEGRVITLEFEDYYFITCYTPNSKRKLERLDYRVVWEDAFREYLNELDKSKPVILCGDLNVAHNEIDLANPDTNHKSAGFSDEERAKFTELLENGYVDTFRHFYPDKAEEYSWWSNFNNARERNIGWRIDYFVVSERFVDRLEDAKIHQGMMGSDHCPVELILK
ncbi:exodeoxyribonuclease-3 [Peptoniphilus asaccharolyticus DSM 20463]|uniref:Exodeoxyribonuclease-3 n=1 Tax=Peptoniphilus asaccharolyticus DSM 20463 TaxID=573058 RepID=A0A1W1V6D3_PEPAS|nr:exodeoxyribonuclease III [Peptoniphilus asaccharolyticus]MBL7574272.1 exodeoxyribonuclease III [Peptoniphilus asaccharolyticus]MBL7575990.1 exodeoxyribonuclease III [Peptoniphilus asaccharolyticus]MBL7576004.1 exodeoxyribonuclease III [Peptoniphilus asaccharolyticus]MBL7576409.1 exodeoxyribonuclease III [Peptoniphilus asaccharolyticus]SMB88826.1 exodeoxyribonuclease-3 [Peptoniphilus asaccharolyticus DSM 20463]